MKQRGQEREAKRLDQTDRKYQEKQSRTNLLNNNQFKPATGIYSKAQSFEKKMASSLQAAPSVSFRTTEAQHVKDNEA